MNTPIVTSKICRTLATHVTKLRTIFKLTTEGVYRADSWNQIVTKRSTTEFKEYYLIIQAAGLPVRMLMTLQSFQIFKFDSKYIN